MAANRGVAGPATGRSLYTSHTHTGCELRISPEARHDRGAVPRAAAASPLYGEHGPDAHGGKVVAVAGTVARFPHRAARMLAKMY